MDNFDPGHLSPRPLWESIVDPLRRAIILGELPADLHLEEPALAQKFGVSRIPVREALVRLEHEGLVRVEPRRGVFVVGMTLDDARDLYEFRLLLETNALPRAAARVDAEAIAALDAIVAEMDRAIQGGQPQLMADPDVRFHRQLVALSGSRQLLTAWDRIAGVIATILGITDATYRDPRNAVHGHEKLIAALGARDVAAAERTLREHLGNGERILREAMDSARAVGAPSK